MANSAVNTTSRLTTSIEVSLAASRRTICSRCAVALLGSVSMLHPVGAAGGVGALLGTWWRTPPLSGRMYHVSVGGPPSLPAAGQQRCRDQDRGAGQRDCPSHRLNGRTEVVSCILVCRAVRPSRPAHECGTPHNAVWQVAPAVAAMVARRLAKAVAELDDSRSTSGMGVSSAPAHTGSRRRRAAQPIRGEPWHPQNPGGRPPSSTRSTSAASPTATATASATSRDCATALPYLARARRRRHLDQPLVPVTDGRRRLRRGRLPRHRTALRHPGRGRPGDRRGARGRHPRAARHRAQPHFGPARWFVAALAGDPKASASAITFGPVEGKDGAQPPNDWQSVFGGPAWTRVRRRRVVPAPLRARPARLQLGEPRGARRVRGRAGVLVRQGRRRLPHRRRARSGEGRRPARRRRRTRRRTGLGPAQRIPSRPGIRTACTTSTAGGVRWRIAMRPNGSSSPRHGCPTTNGWRATCAPTSCTPPSSSTSCARRGGRAFCGR